MALTESAIHAAKPRERLYKVGDSNGLFLQVSPTGGKRWRFKYRFGRKEKQLSLGIYPAVSIEEAREQRDKCRALRAAGIDPSEARKSERASRRAAEDRQGAPTRFTLDHDGALSFFLGKRRLALTPSETAELRVFLDATRAVRPKEAPCR